MSAPSPGDETVELRRFVLPGLFVLALFIALWVRRPDDVAHAHQWVLTGQAFGTTYSVKVIPGPEGGDQAALQTAIDAQIALVNTHMSTYHDDSELSRLNRNTETAPVPVSAALRVVLVEAQRVHALSGGAFDVTIGPLVNAWGFGPELVTPPSPAMLAAAKARVGTEKFQLDLAAGTLTRKEPDLYIDLSAIAKGYGVDLIGGAIEASGHARYLAEIGGEVRARGTNREGKPWSVGIEVPDGGAQDVAEQLPLRDVSIATSGNYRNLRTVDGETITHILDARTGEPVSHGLGSVSVLHPSCMTADALATALYVLGAEDGHALAEREGIAALFLGGVEPGTTPRRSPTSAYLALTNAPSD